MGELANITRGGRGASKDLLITTLSSLLLNTITTPRPISYLLIFIGRAFTLTLNLTLISVVLIALI
jgi:hypothetical protein